MYPLTSIDERLKQFINDINRLENRLWRLAPALKDALGRYEEPDVDGLKLRCDLKSLVGDVERTIFEAKELASRHTKIQRNAAGFIHNVIWGAHAEPRVDVLRKAMQFQAQKIFLLIEPINLKLLTTIDGKMDEMLEILSVNAQAGPYNNALQAASARGDEQVVKLLLGKGADVNAQAEYFGITLQEASEGDHEQVVKLLLVNNGVNMGSKSSRGQTALFEAVSNGHEAVVKLLLSKGIPPEPQNIYEETALSRAAFCGHQSVVELLLAVPGVKSDSIDHYGRTLLWWAAAGGKEATVKLLLIQYFSDPGIADNFGQTPLSTAARKRHHAVVKSLLAVNADDQRYIICDICAVEIAAVDFHYHCRICANRDWDVCKECIAGGASCMKDTHELAKRVTRDGFPISVTG